MLNIFFCLLLCFCVSAPLALSTPIRIAEGAGNSQPASDAIPSNIVKARLLSDVSAIVPGKPFKLGVELQMLPGWHTYYKESGEAGMPTRIEWVLPPGFKASGLLWEKPHKFKDSGIVTYGYKDKTIIVSTITPAAGLESGKKFDFGARVEWLSCKDVCVPGTAKLALSLPISQAAPAVIAQNAAEFALADYDGLAAAASMDNSSSENSPKISVVDSELKIAGAGEEKPNLLLYLAFAFIGGFILNFMPCVLPVISIKIFSLIRQAGDDPGKIVQHGLTFALGIMLSFMALGGLVIAIQGAGQKIGWGFQFQYPVFVFAMAAVVTVFALSMFGLFYIQVTAGQSQIDKLASSEGLGGTFFKGVLATVLSTPCTAPFLGTALGFAFAQPWWLILAIFFTISMGMASPYILLTLQPSWMKYLPKPGVWMEKFKESMGFLLLATVVWLLWVLGNQVGIDACMAATAFLLCLSLSCWFVGRFIDLTSSQTKKAVVWALAAIVVGAAYYGFLRPFPELLSTDPAIAKGNRGDSPGASGGIPWRRFTLEELDRQTSLKKTVFIDFTADWCLTCKANEQTVIDTAPVIDKFKALNVVPLRADWTTQDPEITRILQKFGRSGVPLYVIFPSGRPLDPIVLPELINQSIVLEALDRAGSSR